MTDLGLVVISNKEYQKMQYDCKKQLRSFGYAWKGIRDCVGKEQNLNFHLVVSVLVVVAGLALDIRPLEWVAVLLCMGLVIGAELFNTAIERLVDLVSPQWHPLAGRVKDIAAGAVLVCAVVSVAVGLIVFVPYLTRLCL